MSSRKLLMYLDGLLSDARSQNGWYARQVSLDFQKLKEAQAKEAELLARAENKAQCTGGALDMADLQG